MDLVSRTLNEGFVPLLSCLLFQQFEEKTSYKIDNGIKNDTNMHVSHEIVSPTYVEVRQIGQMLSSGSALILQSCHKSKCNTNRVVITYCLPWLC